MVSSPTNGDGAEVESSGPSPDELDFAAIRRLMTSKYTVALVDRHVSAVRKVCKTCKHGFLLRHLEDLIDLIRLVLERLGQGQHEFGQAIQDFLRASSHPFVSCKSSDMVTYGHHMLNFLKTLMGVLPHAMPIPESELEACGDDHDARQALVNQRTTNEHIRIELAHLLACWARYGLDGDNVELKPNQPIIQAVADAGTPNLRMMRQAQVIDALSSAFRSEDSPEAVVIMLGAIRDMSLYRPLARQITNCGLFSNLVHVVRVNMLGSDVLLVAAEVLWNLLELDWEGAAQAAGQEDIIESFRDFMAAVLTKGYRFKDKIFRNDMMVLLMYISKREENRPLFASTGLMALLLFHAGSDAQRRAHKESGLLDELCPSAASTRWSAGVMGSEHESSGHVPLTNSQEDMEFRTLLWGTLARCCSSQPCAELSTRMGFLPALLSHLDQNSNQQDQRQWSNEQRRKVQLESLSALFQLVQYVPDVFLESDGNAIVMQLMQATRSREVQRKCLHLLQVAVRIGPAFADELARLGAVGVLIEIFSDKDNSMTSRQLCASVLAGLCAGHADNCREFRKKDGVEVLREEIAYKPDDSTDNHLFYAVCVVDCVWCAIVGTRKNEIRFLDVGGLFALLDVLEMAPMLLKRQIIGCIADLLQYRKAAKLITQWNSQVTMKGALKILLELWHSEQEKAKSVGEVGVLKDPERPLNPLPDLEPANGGESASRPGTGDSDSSAGGVSRASLKLQHARSFAESVNAKTAGSWKPKRDPFRTEAAEPASESNVEQQDCRAKIYSILAAVGFEGTEALSIGERQHMELVKLYTQSVQLEKWIEVKENLAQRRIEPVSADAKWIEDSIAEGKAHTTWVQSVQQHLATQKRNDEHAHLMRFWDDIRTRAQFRRTSTNSKDGGPQTQAAEALA